MTEVRRLLPAEAMTIARDAKIVALRWDLVPWGLVLDVDAVVPERGEGVVTRAWLVFYGVGDVSWRFDQARLPNGCWISSLVSETREDGELCMYRFRALLPRFSPADQLLAPLESDVAIQAMAIHGAIAQEFGHHDGFRNLPWAARQQIATDERLLSVLPDLLLPPERARPT